MDPIGFLIKNNTIEKGERVMDKYSAVRQLTFGVSFNHMFKLLDSWGEIADDILYNNKYFSAEYFPSISPQYTLERSLSNPKTGNQISLSAFNLVYTHNIYENYDQEYKEFRRRVENYIVPKILSSHGLVVRRLGVVYVSEVKSKEMKDFTSLYFNPAVQGIGDFRFSKKETTEGGLLLADNQDYINKIYNVGSVGAETKELSYDFQLHFVPIRQDVRDIITRFMKMANEGFSKDILSHLHRESR